MPNPILDPLDDTPPTQLTARSAQVELGKLATFRFTGDAGDTSSATWFDTGAQLAHPVQTGNEVMYLVDGSDAFTEMVRVMGNATDPNKHFIYMLNWACFSSFPLPTSASLRAVLQASQAQVCAIFWAGAIPRASPKPDNKATADFINSSVKNGQAIVADNTLVSGSHHQKVLVVFGSEAGADTLTAFVGGIDWNPDRTFPQGSNGAGQAGGPMHDVHCRVRGPAAADILATFVDRWTDSGRTQNLHALAPSALALVSSAPPRVASGPATQPGRLNVQVARTLGNGTAHMMNSGSAYDFAPTGERTVQAMMLKAIAAARRYIYIEDQYLISMRASQALVAALPNIRHLTVLIPHPSLSDMPKVWARRKAFIDPLRAADHGSVKKVRIFVKKGWQSQQAHSYVHAKTWVIDDKFAVIGSANCNNRGWNHDSEIVVGVFDPSVNDHASFTFAHRLRIKLWAEHLNMQNATGHALLADPIAGAKYWLASGSMAELYDENSGSDSTLMSIGMGFLGGVVFEGDISAIDEMTDPDGS